MTRRVNLDRGSSWLQVSLLPLLIAVGLGNLPAEELRVYELGQQPNDERLRDPKDLNGYFPFEVPASAAAWEARADELRRQVLIATGLWPLPERTPLNPAIYGKSERPGFTVEKVFFEIGRAHV